MTANQIAYWNLQETNRSNVARETETNRSNLAKEKETNRSNKVNEGLTRQRDLNNYLISLQQLRLTDQQNRWYRDYQDRQYWENRRHTLVSEKQEQSKIDNSRRQTTISQQVANETVRSHKANETIQTVSQSEIIRNNKANNAMNMLQTIETARTHRVNESISLENLNEIKSNNLRNYHNAQRQFSYQFLSYDEAVRHNKAVELETRRSNKANELIKTLDVIGKGLSSASKGLVSTLMSVS